MLSKSIPAAVVSLSLVAPAFAHEETVSPFEALVPAEDQRQTIPPDMDCNRNACLDLFEKHDPHWHSSRREDEELEESNEKGTL